MTAVLTVLRCHDPMLPCLPCFSTFSVRISVRFLQSEGMECRVLEGSNPRPYGCDRANFSRRKARKSLSFQHVMRCHRLSQMLAFDSVSSQVFAEYPCRKWKSIMHRKLPVQPLPRIHAAQVLAASSGSCLSVVRRLVDLSSVMQNGGKCEKMDLATRAFPIASGL
jgi:hypothetical protein